MLLEAFMGWNSFVILSTCVINLRSNSLWSLNPEHKLFIGMLPKNVSEVEVSALFSQYGTIKDLQILRGSQQTSKGADFTV